jgi:hypothetical protein
MSFAGKSIESMIKLPRTAFSFALIAVADYWVDSAMDIQA